MKQRCKWSLAAAALKLGNGERMVRGGPVGASPFYRGHRAMRGGGDRRVKRGMLVLRQPFLGVELVGRSS
jgi:hypothetical protein